MSFKNKKYSRTSVSPPGRGLNHYTHVELDVIHARLARHSPSSRYKTTANHGLRVKKIDTAIGHIVQFMTGGCGEQPTQSVQGRPDERVMDLNLELKSLLQTLTLAKLVNSADLQMVNPDSILTETVNAQIGDCCAALDAFFDGIRRTQTNIGYIVWGWWSGVSRWDGFPVDERKLADFTADLSDTRKMLRRFMLTLTATLDSQPPAPVDPEEMGSSGHMLRNTAPTYGQSDDEERNLEIQPVSNNTHSTMFQDSNGTNINGANMNSIGHNMFQFVEHNTHTAQNIFNVTFNGPAHISSLPFNPQYRTTPVLPDDDIPAGSLLASPSITCSPSSPTASPD